mmetsp:Transcript_2632/g.5929  ORF Transcript_2632/g.5929 Transcript_2632/m.5929 type:complete len:218 (-) Transcript_2632:153-806(-)
MYAAWKAASCSMESPGGAAISGMPAGSPPGSSRSKAVGVCAVGGGVQPFGCRLSALPSTGIDGVSDCRNGQPPGSGAASGAVAGGPVGKGGSSSVVSFSFSLCRNGQPPVVRTGVPVCKCSIATDEGPAPSATTLTGSGAGCGTGDFVLTGAPPALAAAAATGSVSTCLLGPGVKPLELGSLSRSHTRAPTVLTRFSLAPAVVSFRTVAWLRAIASA